MKLAVCLATATQVLGSETKKAALQTLADSCNLVYNNIGDIDSVCAIAAPTYCLAYTGVAALDCTITCDFTGVDTCAAAKTGLKAVCDAITACATGSAPCFGRDTMVDMADGSTMHMTDLTAGDYVVGGRVIVNQHKNADLLSALLKVEHAEGSISLTPDHVLNVDGSFVAAREAVVGSKLGASEVSRVTETTGGIINPLTTSGTIMADGVLASTYPEWIASYMLGRSTASVSSLLSFLFPATTQAYYDAALERFFQSTSTTLVHLKAVLPSPLVALIFVVADVLVAAGFVAFSLGSLKSLVALVALGSALKSRK